MLHTIHWFAARFFLCPNNYITVFSVGLLVLLTSLFLASFLFLGLGQSLHAFLQLKLKKIHNFAFILSFLCIGYVTSFLILLILLQERLLFVTFGDLSS